MHDAVYDLCIILTNDCNCVMLFLVSEFISLVLGLYSSTSAEVLVACQA